MSHEVIMPALGMAQDTGLLVAWHKNVGDKVSATDILMEVETDKSTMEVEAGADGFITELRADAGNEVPVGQVVAVISDTPGAAGKAAGQPVAEAKTEAPKAEAPKAEAVAPAPDPKPAAKPAQAKQPPASADGRILASPKARRLAAEQGLDLSRLATAGVPQPYHVADLDALRALPAATHQALNHVSARVAAKGFAQFVEWLDGELAEPVQQSAIWAAFAAACLREESSAEQIGVRVLQPALGTQADYADPDKGRFSSLRPDEVMVPHLVLHDLSGSRLTRVQTGAVDCPILSIVQNGDDYELTLAFAEGQLPAQAALALIDGIAGRVEEPLRHLL